MSSDGASRSNPGPASIGVVFYNEQQEEIASLSEAIGIASNNVAEYTALVCGLEYALKQGYTELVVKADSELMIKQLKGEYKVKNEALKKLYLEAKSLASQFKSLSYIHVPRELNKRADKLANLALDR